MTTPLQAADRLQASLASLGDPASTEALQRYFPHRVEALGVSNAAVRALADEYFTAHICTPADRWEITELILARARYHEEVMLGFAVLHKVVRRDFNAALMERFRHWLENVVTNWAQCDDLCLKLAYPFFLRRRLRALGR